MKELSIPEQILMTAIWRLKDDAYGVTIRKKAAEVTGKDIIYGTLYNFLDQLLRKGYVTKTRSEPIAERGGRSRMYYELTNSGLESLRTARDLQQNIWIDIPNNAFNAENTKES